MISKHVGTWGTKHIPIQIVYRHTEVVGHTGESNDTVTLQKLLVSPKTHLTNEPCPMLVEVPVLCEELVFNAGECDKE